VAAGEGKKTDEWMTISTLNSNLVAVAGPLETQTKTLAQATTQ
jgi:hypothetical protein